MKSKVLVTGVAGLLGSNFSRYLISKGYKVVGIDNFSGGFKENLADNVKCAQIDLIDLEVVDNFFAQEKPDFVYHFAAYAAEGLSPFVRRFNYQNNLIASANVITSCINHDIKKLIFSSSMAVYGNNTTPFVEDMVPLPEDPYGVAKYAVEMDLKMAKAQFGLDYSIIRPHNVVGIYQNIWDRYRNVIGIWIRKSIQGEPLPIFGDGLQKRAFSDIQFYHEPFEKLMSDFGGEIFNLGADRERSILETAELVKDCATNFELYPEIIHYEARHEVKNAYCSHDKAKRLLEFKDETDLRQTINQMFEWALKQPNHQIKNQNYEITKKIYSFWK